ncbi:heme o synthase [Anaerobacillus isosaccharinicus]|uniref:Protoheme IX farnesyltransferase n=1 Tax=Anaerobacillus isosaccharinicus TaxID=1532552 RepID=A0A1S2L7E8_9BACI|nr:heme o synthase [Anaerobacillus isosaccharinicus]MBA5585055.1 protoheme IX farnesyltransferase [Anaerobacillus isosaccharinicus]QOY36598.1 protoheme IX farnesyltransferase [Anaerobacillus isosaccharinicus]
MNKQDILSSQKVGETSRLYINNNNASTLITDLKSLLKLPVLIANVLPVFTGFWLALYFSNASFNDYLGMFLLTIIGSTLVMAGALVLNNWYDVDIDSIMARTKKRPTVTGNIPLKVVLIIGIILTLLGFILLLFTTVEATIYAFIGWFTYVFLYTMWSKRKYTLNTVIGSVSGAVTPLIGWTAIASGFHIVPIILFSILFIWQMPHTFAIAMRKCEEYRAAGVAMLPVVHGFKMTKRQMLVYVACLLPLPIYLLELGTTFFVIATLLNLIWLGICINGLFMRDDEKYAYINFLYSVNYITILFLLMILVTSPVSQ